MGTLFIRHLKYKNQSQNENRHQTVNIKRIVRREIFFYQRIFILSSTQLDPFFTVK